MRLASPDAIQREWDAVAKLGACHLVQGDADYPALLSETDSAPPVLIIRGDAAMLTASTVAIVGARNASAAAQRFARELGQGLASHGVTVVSGLARGIDTAAHVGAMAGGGRTAGIIASGLDVAFPPENADLQQRMGDTQLVVTEHPPGTEPMARHFPARNRIIAGLALGTVVVEAAPKSGSLITARLAGEFGRDVMAVPGSPLDPRAQGCNALIRDGATLIQNADDVLEQIRAPFSGVREPRLFPSAFVADGEGEGVTYSDPSDAERQAIVDLLGPSAVSVDELVRASGQSAPAVQMVLLELELAGRLERHAASRVSLIAA